MTRADGAGHGFNRSDDVRDIRVLGLRQRCRHADRDPIHVRQPTHVAGRLDLAGAHQGGKIRSIDIADARDARVHRVYDTPARVKPDYLVTGSGNLHRQRQAHVPQANHAEDRGAVVRLPDQRLLRTHLVGDPTFASSTSAPPLASERDAARNTRMTVTPASASARDSSVPLATRTK